MKVFGFKIAARMLAGHADFGTVHHSMHGNIFIRADSDREAAEKLMLLLAREKLSPVGEAEFEEMTISPELRNDPLWRLPTQNLESLGHHIELFRVKLPENTN